MTDVKALFNIGRDTSHNWKQAINSLSQTLKDSIQGMVFFENDTKLLKVMNGSSYEDSFVLNYFSGDVPISAIIFAGSLQSDTLKAAGYLPIINDTLYSIEEYAELYAIIKDWEIVVTEDTNFKFNIPKDSVLRLLVNNPSQRTVGSYQKNAIIDHTHTSLIVDDTVSSSDESTISEKVIDTVSDTSDIALKVSSISRVGDISEEGISSEDETRMDNIGICGYIKAKNTYMESMFYQFLGDIRLIPFTTDEIPRGWYFCNGDNYALTSSQGKILNSFSNTYKTNWGIVVDGENICVPNMFYSDGRGYFIRSVDGTTRAVGSIAHDELASAFRNITSSTNDPSASDGEVGDIWIKVIEDGQIGPVTETLGDDTHPLNIGMLPVIYLGV